jgi:hypothetical protein
LCLKHVLNKKYLILQLEATCFHEILAIAHPAAPKELQGVTHTGRFVDFQIFNSWRVLLPSPGYVTTWRHRRSSWEYKFAGFLYFPQLL